MGVRFSREALIYEASLPTALPKSTSTVSPTFFPIARRRSAFTGSMCVPSPMAMNELRNECSSIFASSLWYNALLFGRQFVELSGVAGSPQPNAVKALCELLRTFVLAYVIARLIVRLNVTEWRAALGVGLWLWVGFPVVLLTGSMLWQNVPWQLAAIHSGDWLIKLVLITRCRVVA